MSYESKSGPPERRITRHGLESVIRRAVELYTAAADASDGLSEEEVLHIGAELGLPADMVRQALYELPDRQPEASLVARVYGPRAVSVARGVPRDAAAALASLQDYLTTREYLQVRRSKPGHLWLEPADDAISNVARAFSRPAARWYLARAQRVILAVRPLEQGRSHVRIEADIGHRRRGAVTAGLLAGGIIGLGAAAVAGAAASIGAGELIGPIGGMVAGGFAGVTALGAGLGGGLAVTAARFRRRVAAARIEIEGLLDRLERGERLEPPPAPWRRRLQMRLARRLPPGG